MKGNELVLNLKESKEKMIYFVTNEQDNFDCLTSGVSKHTCFCRARAKNLGNLPKRLFGLTLVTQRVFSLNTMHNTTILNVWVIGTIYWLVTLDPCCLIYQKTYDRNTLPYKAVSFIGMWWQSHEKHRNRESEKHLPSICPPPCFLMIVPLLFNHI